MPQVIAERPFHFVLLAHARLAPAALLADQALARLLALLGLDARVQRVELGLHPRVGRLIFRAHLRAVKLVHHRAHLRHQSPRAAA